MSRDNGITVLLISNCFSQSSVGNSVISTKSISSKRIQTTGVSRSGSLDDGGSNSRNVNRTVMSEQLQRSTKLYQNQYNNDQNIKSGGSSGARAKEEELKLLLPTITIQNSSSRSQLTTYAEKAKSSYLQRWL